jgi:glycerol uptake facilitator protein
MIGTYIQEFYGTGAVHVAVLTGTLQGLWQVAVVWALGISMAIYATAALSGAHINPAVTVAFAVFRDFPWRKVVPYVAAQLVGAFLAAATLYTLFCGILQHFETAHNIVRGQAGSELSAMVYGEYFPNPAAMGAASDALASLSAAQAIFAEGIGTAFLAFFVFSLTEVRNGERPGNKLVPAFIGLGVAAIICVIAPLTQAGLNPARDFGPRLFSWLAGWGSVAIPGPRGGFFTVYILAPILGALVGASVYQFVLRPQTGALTPPKE